MKAKQLKLLHKHQNDLNASQKLKKSNKFPLSKLNLKQTSKQLLKDKSLRHLINHFVHLKNSENLQTLIFAHKLTHHITQIRLCHFLLQQEHCQKLKNVLVKTLKHQSKKLFQMYFVQQLSIMLKSYKIFSIFSLLNQLLNTKLLKQVLEMN